MALTRAQLLMGNDSQGAVLPGEVQAVKQGAGIFIDTDGTISVDASSVVGLVKLNNAAAFNGYVWPSVSGSAGQVLTKGTGNLLEWTNGGVFVSDTAPLNPEIGDLWFDCTVGELLVYEACTSGAPKWTGGAAGLPVIPGNTSASPAFASGSGTFASPYICTASSASVSGAVVVNRVTVTDLAPFQFVQIVDLNGVVNGGRFSVSNNVANASGILVFDLLFNDSPTSVVGTTYTCALKIGTGTIYVNAPVTLTDVFVLNSPGSISGSGIIGSPLTYTVGTAAGGAPPFSYTWEWKLFSNNTVLQNNGLTYTPLAAQFDDSIYVTLTAQDDSGQIVSGSTADFGPISKPPFPNPTPPTIPNTISGTSTFNWDGDSTTLSSGGCLLFSVQGAPFSQGPTTVTSSESVTTKWSDSAPNICGNAVSDTLIEGCLFDSTFSTCASFVIDRKPEPFVILPVGDIPPDGVATSTFVTPTGYNAPAFITVGPGSNGLAGSYQAKVGSGSFVTVPLAGTYTLAISPGQTLAVRFTTGSAALTEYTFQVQLGDSTGSTNVDFDATTGNTGFPSTPITFPTATAGTDSVATSVAWGNGTTNIEGVGCIEFSTDGGSSFTQSSTTITDGVQLKTRFKAGASCADNTNGQSIGGAITNTTYIESTILTIDRVPDAVTFSTTTSATTLTQYTSNTLTPTNYNSTGYLTLGGSSTLTNVKASVGGGAFTLIPNSGTSLPINPGQSIQIQGTTGSTASTTYTANVLIGVSGSTTTSTYSVEVGVAAPAIVTPSIVTPFNGATGVGTETGLTLTSSTYLASGGAGTHASSSWEVYASEKFNPVTSAIQTISSTPTYVYQVVRSIRCYAPQKPYLTRTPAVDGDRKRWTFSCWVRKSALSTPQGLFVGGSVAKDQINFQLSNNDDNLIFTDILDNVTSANLVTTQAFTDINDWMHIVLSVNTTTAVSVNRIRLYINGTQITSFSTNVVYPQNAITTLNSTTPFVLGANGIGTLTNHLSSYLAAVTFVDGLSLTPSSFGVLSGTTWTPIGYAGAFGTNGYELLFNTDFDSVTTTTTMGKDTSGNNNDFTPVNIYTKNSNAIIWSGSAPPSAVNVLVVGQGSNLGICGGGGGGGGVAEGTTTPVASQEYFIQTRSGFPGTSSNDFSATGVSSIYNVKGVQIVAGGGRPAPAPAGPVYGDPSRELQSQSGATSGTPQSNVGGTTADLNNGCGRGAAGGGGAGGPGGANSGVLGGGGGSGINKTIRGTSEAFGVGGGGACCNGIASAGRGLPGVQGGGVILSIPGAVGTAIIPTFGAGISFTGPTNDGTGRAVITVTNTIPGDDTTLNWLVESPTLGTQADTGLGNQVSGTYATLNATTGAGTFTNGNLDYVTTVGTTLATLSIPNGKYYWEIQAPLGTSVKGRVGIAKLASGTQDPGKSSSSYAFNCANGQIVNNDVSASYGGGVGNNVIVGVAFDADTGRLYFALNNVWQNSGDPVTTLNPAFKDLNSGPYFPAFGGSTSTTVNSVNFGQRPFVYQAPTGFKCLIKNPVQTTLTFADSTGLADFVSNDTVIQVEGGANAIISGINVGGNQISVTNTVGAWVIGDTVKDTTTFIPAPYPTTEPPDPLLYTLIASATDSTTEKTSFLLTIPPIDAFLTYYARVQYKSNATVVTSSYSDYSKFTTGNLA